MSSTPESYCALIGRGSSILREKGSKFIGSAFPVASAEAFKQELSAMRKEHHGAHHWCHAHVLGERGEVQRSNDDGEPSGSAGRPILRHIQGAGLTFTGVIVVRYFGGTLLGKGGLVQAYGGTAALALADAPKEDRAVMEHVSVRCGHAAFERVRSDVMRAGGRIITSEHSTMCEAVVLIPRSQVHQLMHRWTATGAIDARHHHM